MGLRISITVALVSITHHIPAAVATISLGHDQMNNYAWLTGSQPCNPVIISTLGSSECDVEFNLASSGGDVSTYRLEHCGEVLFQLQQHAGGDGWALIASCDSLSEDDGEMDCTLSTGQGSVAEEWRCG